MSAAPPSPAIPQSPAPLPPGLRRVLALVKLVGVASAVGAVVFGARLMSGGSNLSDLFGMLFGLGMLLLAALPPALAALLARRMLRKGPAGSPVALGVRMGALLAYTVAVAAFYLTTFLDKAIWLDAQAGLSFLFLPPLTLAIGAAWALAGALAGGLLMRFRSR